MKLDNVDLVVVGAGVLGLAVAARLSKRFTSVLLIDKADTIGCGTSSRNSEVIHAGIYYPHNSLKATLCLQGRHELYAYCRRRNIAVNQLGKLIVATQACQEDKLMALARHALGNGVDDLQLLSHRQLLTLEPNLSATQALMSPSTGIIDSHAYMYSLLADAEANGVNFCGRTTLVEAGHDGSRFDLILNSDGESIKLATHHLVNCAGLYSTDVAHAIDGLDKRVIPSLYWCKGHYFTYLGKSPFKHLIYPLPDQALKGLGVHATLDMAGQLKFGPDAHYVKSADGEDYGVNQALSESFARAIRQYFPALQAQRLQAAYAGIRPKLQGPSDDQVADFMIQTATEHSVAGLVNLFGMESPGLTASLAIADRVAELID